MAVGWVLVPVAGSAAVWVLAAVSVQEEGYAKAGSVCPAEWGWALALVQEEGYARVGLVCAAGLASAQACAAA
jgi:hypothetical protein